MADCPYWMEGQCRFSNTVCWNIHDPSKKGTQTKGSQKKEALVFQEGREVQELPPGPGSPARRLDGQNWEVVVNRKDRRKILATNLEKEKQMQASQNSSEGATVRTCPGDGKQGQMTPTFPLDGGSKY